MGPLEDHVWQVERKNCLAVKLAIMSDDDWGQMLEEQMLEEQKKKKQQQEQQLSNKVNRDYKYFLSPDLSHDMSVG